MKKSYYVTTALLIAVFFSTNDCLAGNNTNTNKTSHATKGSKAPARKPISAHCDNHYEMELVHVYGRAQFTYYIYDETGCPVMSGSGEFNDNGLSYVTIDTLPSGDYTIEVVVNGATHLCSFYKM